MAGQENHHPCFALPCSDGHIAPQALFHTLITIVLAAIGILPNMFVTQCMHLQNNRVDSCSSEVVSAISVLQQCEATWVMESRCGGWDLALTT